MNDKRRQFRIYLNAAAVFLLLLAFGTMTATGVLVYQVLHADKADSSLSLLWVLAVWTVLSMVGSAWCRLQALRADAVHMVGDPVESPAEVSALLEKGIERWNSTEETRAPTSSSSTTE